MAGLTITIRLYAILAEEAGARSVKAGFAPGSRVSDAVEWVAGHYPSIAGHLSRCRVALDAEYVDRTAPLHDGATVALIPPVSGGGPLAPFRVTTEPLQAGPLEDHVKNNRSGAVLTFTGVVREFTGDRQTVYLLYEAYEELAERVFERIASQAREKWPGVRVAIWHRVGKLDVGETAIVIAVAAAHRDEAFAACRFAIDRVKRDAPVWKKEVYSDGSHWVLGKKREEMTR